MNECPFCHSKEIKIPTPYLDIHGEKIYTWCCKAQKENQEYIEKHTNPFDGSKPESPEKW